MKKTVKILIIIMIIIIIFLFIALMYLTNRNEDIKTVNNTVSGAGDNNITNEIQYPPEEEVILGEYDETNFRIVENRSYYLLLEKTIENVFKKIKLINSDDLLKVTYKDYSTEQLNKERENIKEEIRNILAKKYLNEFNFNNTIANSLFKSIINDTFNIKQMYQQEIDFSINAFIIYGEFSKINMEYSLMIIVDSMNGAYEVYLDDYMNSHNYTKSNINRIKINSESVEKNKYNNINFMNDTISDEEIAKKYFNHYQYYIQTDAEEIYNKLNKEYKNKKYPNLNSFKKFAQKYKLTSLAEYKVTKKDGYNEFVCVDKFENYIVFKETSIMQFEIILDSYTIDIDTFTSEYKTGNDLKRLNLNINRFNQMINSKDYNAIYSKLNATFKNNNFKTVESLQAYIENNFYNANKIEIESREDQGDYFVVKAKLIDPTKIDTSKTLLIMMKLGESEKFEMSFSVN